VNRDVSPGWLLVAVLVFVALVIVGLNTLNRHNADARDRIVHIHG